MKNFIVPESERELLWWVILLGLKHYVENPRFRAVVNEQIPELLKAVKEALEEKEEKNDRLNKN